MEHPPAVNRTDHPHCEMCEFCGLVPAPRTPRVARLVAQSPAMRLVLARAKKFAESDAPVIVLGESGSGKGVLARTLHGCSLRATRPFVSVNVAALPHDLLEAELFGQGSRQGLFEQASGGTLFLDEVGELPLPLQVKLLHALQHGEVRRVGENKPLPVDTRVICATHRDLEELVAKGTFREDLYYRLKVLTLRVPPLRERREDILPLAHRFLDEEASDKSFAKDAEARLLAHRWPGNVRELQNAVKHGAALSADHLVRADDLPEELLRAGSSSPSAFTPRTLADVEREHVLAVLEACRGSQTEAARVLGIGRNTLWRKLRAWNSDTHA